jgi:hypothetical protein
VFVEAPVRRRQPSPVCPLTRAKSLFVSQGLNGQVSVCNRKASTPHHCGGMFNGYKNAKHCRPNNSQLCTPRRRWKIQLLRLRRIARFGGNLQNALNSAESLRQRANAEGVEIVSLMEPSYRRVAWLEIVRIPRNFAQC